MLTFQILLRRLGSGCTAFAAPLWQGFSVRNIQLPAMEPCTMPEPGVLYVGAAEELRPLFTEWNGVAPLMLMIAGNAEPLSAELAASNVLWAAFDLPLMELSSRIMRASFAFQHWCDELRGDIFRQEAFHVILQKMADEIHLPLFWLNSGCRVLAANVNYAFEDRYISEMLTGGYLSSVSSEELFRASRKIPLPGQSQSNAYVAQTDTGRCTVLCEIWSHRSLVGQLLIFAENEEQSRALWDYTQIFDTFLVQYGMLEKSGEVKNNSGYPDLLADILQKKIKSESELSSRIARLSPPAPAWYRCVVVGFKEQEIEKPYVSLANALASLLPEHVVVQLDKVLVLFLRKKSNEVLKLPVEKLELLLKKHKAHACVGGQSQFLTSFRPIFLQTQRNFMLGVKMRAESESHLFWGEEYQIYQIVDICARQGQDFHEGNLVYLCSPRYTALRRHDQEHKDTLCHVLEVYILCNCNATLAAKTLFLHRNTLMNKLTKIEEIVGGSLDDFSLKFDLIFSSKVMHYAESYIHNDPLQLKLHWGEDTLPTAQKNIPDPFSL